eukprot:scpid110856/ scgid6503/ 
MADRVGQSHAGAVNLVWLVRPQATHCSPHVYVCLFLGSSCVPAGSCTMYESLCDMAGPFGNCLCRSCNANISPKIDFDSVCAFLRVHAFDLVTRVCMCVC